MQTISPPDLRRREREPVAIPVSLVLRADKLKLDTFTTTMNISLSGVGIRTMLALVPKQEVEIVIKGQFSQTIPARVVWAREEESSNSTIAGLKFLL
ncbi:MAG: PilZ domain-containing protein [Terriglobia bacterium]|jgi:c-di-GMP-binding flagellar brake protein YcgR